MLFITLCAPVAAGEECGKWVAGPWVSAGYDVTAAAVCTYEGADVRTLRMLCGSERRLFISYDAIDDLHLPKEGEDVNLLFDSGDERLALKFGFDENDFELWTAVPFDGPLTALIKNGRSLTLTELGGQRPPLVFSLEGSAAALVAVERTCNAYD